VIIRQVGFSDVFNPIAKVCNKIKERERRGEGGRGWPRKLLRSPAAPPKEKRGEEEKTISRRQGT
jgi:hypothetical protein